MQSLTALTVSAQMRVPRSVGDCMNIHSVLTITEVVPKVWFTLQLKNKVSRLPRIFRGSKSIAHCIPFAHAEAHSQTLRPNSNRPLNLDTAS